tara:strand:+ start:907 stop:1746 length:840 start_codon:yes stop_codon:yes gene_type:complete
MCTPAIAVGALIGGGVGYAAGGKRGALLGAVAGGFGGGLAFPGSTFGFGAGGSFSFFGPSSAATIAAGGTVSGSQIVAAAGGALPPPGVAGGGGGFWSSLGSTIFSPQFALGTQLIGFGVQMAGMQQQAAFQRSQIAFQQALLRNRQIAVEQDIKARQLRLQVQKGIIGNQGAQARGALRAEAAGRGVLVDIGSERDRTEQLAGDVAFAKLVEEHKTALQDRQDRIVASGLSADSALLDFQLADTNRAQVFGGLNTALKTAQGFSKFRFNTDGELAFRT